MSILRDTVPTRFGSRGRFGAFMSYQLKDYNIGCLIMNNLVL